nr:methyltransferase domain-containing protein [Natranaeroarchaeum aerophilus]
MLELGGEDDRFAAREAASAASDPELVAPGVVTARAIDRETVSKLAYTRRASELVGTTDADVDSAEALLTAAPLDREGTVAVRAVDVRSSTGVDTQRVERALGDVLVSRGFTVDLDDPDHVLRAVFTDESAWERDGDIDPREAVTTGTADPIPVEDDPDDLCALGWLAVESVREYGSRAPTDRPFFQPGSMDPLLARALVNIAGARPGTTLVDPMCGTGGVLIEGGLVGGSVLGVDAQAKMARGTAQNLAELVPDERVLGTMRGDATALPLADDAADAVVFDAPYGRQSKIANLDLAELVAGALAEARRIADRAVVVADRSWETEARAAGWTVDARFERRVHRSLTRYVLVLSSE